MKWPFTTLTLLAMLAAPTDPPKDAPKPAPAVADIAGIYDVTGSQEDGKTYRGIAVIRKARDHYIVNWLTGPDSVLGVGVRVGDTLSVGWVIATKEGAIRGVTTYRVNGKRLEGR